MFAGGDHTFSLSVGAGFQTKSLSLSLKLVGKLDRESVPEYNLKVFAIDGNEDSVTRHNATLSVTVIVEDVNDNVPAFDFSHYYAKFILPVEVGTELIQVQATDSDTGENGKITYNISELSEHFEKFSVDADSGKIQLDERISSNSGKFTVFIRVFAQ